MSKMRISNGSYKVPAETTRFLNKILIQIIKQIDHEKIKTTKQYEKLGKTLGSVMSRLMNAFFGELGRFRVEVFLVDFPKTHNVRTEVCLTLRKRIK